MLMVQLRDKFSSSVSQVSSVVVIRPETEQISYIHHAVILHYINSCILSTFATPFQDTKESGASFVPALQTHAATTILQIFKII
jgi:hypothetical protein